MRAIRTCLLAYMVMLAASSAANAQELLVTDLAVHPVNTTVTYSVDAGTYKVVVRHIVPSQRPRYTVRVTVANVPVPPLAADDLQQHNFSELQQAPGGVARCARLAGAYAGLWSATEEDQVPQLTEDLRQALADDPSTAGCTAESVRAAESLLLSTTIELARSYSISRGQELSVAVTKRPTAAGQAITWTSVYTPGARGAWRASYGFSFVSNWPFGDDRYFAKDVGDGRYVVDEEESRTWMHFVPSIFFTWLPAEAELKNWHTSWTGGLGFDLTAPVVFLGWSSTYNQNLSFSYGVAIRQQQILLGRYSPGDTIQANLTEGQLHAAQYRPNPFFSVALRFGANPFARREEQ